MARKMQSGDQVVMWVSIFSLGGLFLYLLYTCTGGFDVTELW